MASPPARPHPSEDEPVQDEPIKSEPVEDEPVGVSKRESFGPLELERHLKADGRALILYTRSGETGPSPRPAASTPGPRSAGGDRAIGDHQP